MLKKESEYTVGSRWMHHFGNGFMITTIIAIVDNFKVEVAEYGIVQKSWLGYYWYKMW